MLRRDVQKIAGRLADKRSGKVVFLSHCLLNENTRYLGGACHGCCVPGLLRQCEALDLGIVQMPCPEEVAWGGVMKRRYLGVFGLVHRWRLPGWTIAVIGSMASGYTRLQYRRLARKVARQVLDYRLAGYEVAGIVGVDGSPSCGVTATMPVATAFASVAEMDPETLRVDALNDRLMQLVRPGAGVFINQVARALRRRGQNVRFLAHDLRAELQGCETPLPLGQGRSGGANDAAS